MYSCNIVKSLFELNDLEGFKMAKADLLKQLKVGDTRALGSEELLGAITSTNLTLSRNNGALIFIYQITFGTKKKCTVVRREE